MKARPQKIPRIIYNDDSCTLRLVPPPHTVASVACALDYLKGTQVDCLSWCVGNVIAYSWPSKVMENIYDLAAKGASRSGGWDRSQDVMNTLHDRGVDYLPLLIARAKAQGLMFLASFRMNDTHLKSEPDGILSPEFWKTHQHCRLWGVTEGKSYYNAALDYSFEAVRKHYREAICEMAAEYDVDGIELDFTRSPYFFQPEETWRKRGILTRFVREVRKELQRIGAKRKRKLTLVTRIPADERRLATAGIDARKWITEGLMDSLIVSELANDFNQELKPWLDLCREAGVRLYPAVEAGPVFMNAEFYSTRVNNPLAPAHSFGVSCTPEEDVRMQRGMAQNFWVQGCDGIAMFNFPCKLVEGRNIMHTDKPAFRRLTAVLREAGTLQTLARKNKRYTFYRDLPIYVEANRPRRFHQTIPFTIRGRDISLAKVILKFRQIAERNPHVAGTFSQNPIVKPGLLKYYLNDREIPPAKLKRTRAAAGRISSGFQIGPHEIVELTISGRELRNGENTLAFEMPHFPKERDPYVYIYELDVELKFS